jgi:hypothetical protein
VRAKKKPLSGLLAGLTPEVIGWVNRDHILFVRIAGQRSTPDLVTAIAFRNDNAPDRPTIDARETTSIWRRPGIALAVIVAIAVCAIVDTIRSAVSAHHALLYFFIFGNSLE